MNGWTLYDITPVPKPRMTQRDKWAQRPAVMRYRAYKDEMRIKKLRLPLSHHVVFVLPMPKSWSAKERAKHRWDSHRSKPDVDNLHKGLLDAYYSDDAAVSDARITKIWGDNGGIYVRELEPMELP